MKHLFLSSLLLLSALTVGAQTKPASTSAAHDVIKRFCGKEKINLSLNQKATPGINTDQYTYSVDNKGKLTIEGNSPVALCRGFYDFVRTNGYGINAWSGNRLKLPASLKPSAPKTVTSPFRHHYYYNVVTYGYTNPYWDWNRWQQEIDWMALHGIDMPLALVANEAISARVWKKLGLTDEEILLYFVGPAHLPWMRMGNISGVDSPMPASWHKDQIALQHKILDRMRSLGMKPICPGFAGFLPPEIKRIYPNANVVESEWAGFHNWMLMADDPLFPKIGKLFIEEWEKEFGKCEYYIADSFNEMSIPFPPKGTQERYNKLAQYGKTVYEGIRSANPNATWVMQGWMLGFTRSIWDYESYSALMKEVPDNKVLILDMAEDYNYKWWHNTANWEYFKGFDNKQWVYSTIPNMGGKTGMTGYLEFYANGGRLDALKSPNRGNLVGYGTAPEGTENNEVVYELICDAGWTADSIPLKDWLQNYTLCRYGKTDPAITQYWNEITQSVYNNFTDHPRFVWQLRPGRSTKGTYQIDSLFFTAIEKFAQAAPRLKDNPQYVDDLIELSAQYAGGKMEVLVQNVIQAAVWDEVGKTDSVASLFNDIALATDRLLAAHPIYNLQRWIDFARNHATTPQEATYYEKNAKRIVTIWGPPVNDYSARIWSGLIRDFYAPRYKAYFQSLQTGQPFDYAKWESNWVETSKGLSPVTPPTDKVQACLDLIEKAKPIFYKSTALADERELGTWTPSMLSNEWQEVQWTMPVSELKGLRGVSFRYVRGSEKLEIQKVSLEVDGQIVATNEHNGETGLKNIANDYRLDLPTQLGGNNGVTLKAVVRTTGNCQSFGKVIMIHK
ncbi:MAG: alpha-N-acetylglucosaminidase TIM-barrel domain-containing protein [Bacteroidaceae bacterium]|nr:alpha-N-acetylglucosaminidase TIM-barrel domain-containing protein [Bacteroidaceae bacterium]